MLPLLLTSCIAFAQQAHTKMNHTSSLSIAAAENPLHSVSDKNILRIIHDPGGHALWLLEPDPVHPGGPGRLERVEISAEPSLHESAGEPRMANAETPTELPQSGRSSPQISESTAKKLEAERTPIVRAGERLLIEQHAGPVEAQLMGTALGPACLGSTFEIRLAFSGKRMRATALAPGRAVLEASKELDGASFGGTE